MSCAAALIAFSSSVPGAAGAVLRLAGTLLLGFGLVTMGHCAQHECIHNTAFASRRLNALVAWLVSLPRLTNPRWERMLHKDHHTYTNDPTRDPEIMAGEPANSMPGDLWAYATKVRGRAERGGGGRGWGGGWQAVARLLRDAWVSFPPRVPYLSPCLAQPIRHPHPLIEHPPPPPLQHPY